MQHVHQLASGRGLTAGLSIIPAQRAIRPYDYTPPRSSYGGRVLQTQAGILIGGALPRAASNDDGYACVAPDMTADAIAIQAALTDRRADTPRLIDEVRAFAHELRTDPKLARRVGHRLYDLALRPFVAWC